MKKTKSVMIKLAEDEHGRWQKLAEKDGRPFSSWVRYQVNKRIRSMELRKIRAVAIAKQLSTKPKPV